MITYLVQMNSAWEDKPASIAKARQFIAAAKPLASSLIVLPEMFATGFSIETKITAEPEAGLTEQFLIDMALEHRCAVIGGLVSQGGQKAGGDAARVLAATAARAAREAGDDANGREYERLGR